MLYMCHKKDGPHYISSPFAQEPEELKGGSSVSRQSPKNVCLLTFVFDFVLYQYIFSLLLVFFSLSPLFSF